MFDWLYQFPAIVWGLLLLATMFLAGIAGLVLRRRIFGKAPQDPMNETQDGYIVSSIVTLFAFIVGFTFAIAVDRFEDRRQLVVEDARAIEALYLSTQLLGEPHRTRISDILVRYTDNRVELASQRPEERNRSLAENNRLIRELWTAVIPAFESVRGIDFSSAFVDTANEVVATDAARRAARNAHIPSEVFALLFVYAVVSAMVFGFVLRGRRGRLSGALLLTLCVLAIVLLIDLNQPVTGAIRESQQPMQVLSSWMHNNPPSSFDGLRSPASTVAGQARPQD